MTLKDNNLEKVTGGTDDGPKEFEPTYEKPVKDQADRGSRWEFDATGDTDDYYKKTSKVIHD